MALINDKHKDRLFCYILGREETMKAIRQEMFEDGLIPKEVAEMLTSRMEL